MVRRKNKEGKMVFAVLSIIFVLLLIVKGLWLSPLSDTKALERTKVNIQNGAYCSGYHNNTADGTRVVVFRSKETDEVVDSFEVKWHLGSEIYQKYKKEVK